MNTSDKLLVWTAGIIFVLGVVIIVAVTHPAFFLQAIELCGVGVALVIGYVIRHRHLLAVEARKERRALRLQADAEVARQQAIAEQERQKALMIGHQASLTKMDVDLRSFFMQAAAFAQQTGGSYKFTPQGFEVINPTRVIESSPVQHQQAQITPVATSVQEPSRLPPIPSFSQAFSSGEIDPDREEMLVCYEMERDEETGEIYGVVPRLDLLENNSTIFLGGASKSGKTTNMVWTAGQSAMRGALLYVIDPHLTHPEKSVMVRLAPLRHALIMEPAMRDEEVWNVLQHAKAEASARVNGHETALSGRPILFIVDECLALMGRAQRTDNKQIQALYRELAFFMRDLGTQYAKFGVSGIFASQYVTKDAFKLPGGSVDFRDGCQSQTLLRLPANQAQAMRLIPKEDLRGIRSLPPGHGYMGFSDGDIIRMASGNTTVRDMELVGRMIDPSPLSRQQYGGYQERHTDKTPASSPTSDTSRGLTGERNVLPDYPTTRYVTGGLIQDVEPLPTSTHDEVYQGSSTDSLPEDKYTFSQQEIPTLIALYKVIGNVDKVLREMEKSQRYHKDASRILREKGLLR